MSSRIAGDKSRVKFEGCWSDSRLKLISWQQNVFSPEGPDIRCYLTQTRFRVWWMTRNFRDLILSSFLVSTTYHRTAKEDPRTWRYLTARGKTTRSWRDGIQQRTAAPDECTVCACCTYLNSVHNLSVTHGCPTIRRAFLLEMQMGWWYLCFFVRCFGSLYTRRCQRGAVKGVIPALSSQYTSSSGQCIFGKMPGMNQGTPFFFFFSLTHSRRSPPFSRHVVRARERWRLILVRSSRSDIRSTYFTRRET